MNYKVYIRPLVIADALVSCQWRNNPKIWRFTGSRPDRYITPEIETAWLAEVLQRDNEKRFAICLVDDHKYIGNVFLTDIQGDEAQVHIFVGEMEFWGGHRAHQSICLTFDYGFKELNLETIYGQINANNSASLALCKSLGFVKVAEYYDNDREMLLERKIFTRQMYNDEVHLRFARKENQV